MERVLREPDCAQIDALFARGFDWSGGVAYYPVRHHSPACALHLQKTVEEYRPDVILIEGPADANPLIPYLTDELSVPPLCVYYSYDDQEGRVDENREKYRAYYPFLSYSPEWVALREAKARGIDCAFIDLPYASLLVNRPDEASPQYSYNEDREYEVNRYTAMLARRAGCRSFSEFWESRFELEAADMDTHQFVRGVFALGWFMRLSTPEDDSDFLSDRLREAHMAREIAFAAQTHSRVLVVTGAFHAGGLLERGKESFPALKPHNTADVAAYLMPYTFLEADSRGGYSAGMPFPAYYQNVWERLSKKKRDAYGAAALEYIVKTARYARKTQPVSLPDEINAYQMAISLAALRGKNAPGVYELLDGVRSSFVKGDVNSTAVVELDFLLRLLTGMGAGTVAAGACAPPVVREFRALCAKHHLKTGTAERQDVTLDIVKNPSHLAKSRFLHQLAFLDTGFCKLDSGPDYVSGRDRNLAREHWSCRYGTSVETRLTDLSVFGATLSQICAAQIAQAFRDCLTAQDLGKLLLSVQVMGVEGFYEAYREKIAETVENDRNFESLCGLIASLRYLAHMQRLTGGETAPEAPGLIRTAFACAAALMPVVRASSEDEEQAVCEKLRELYGLTVERPDWCDAELLADQADAALEDGFCNSRFYGACLAIRGKQGAIPPEEFCGRVSAYLDSCMSQPELAASFICGVFMIARDVILTDPAVLERLDRVIAKTDAEQFLAVLPNLRCAFTYFLPTELERLGRAAAALHHTDKETLTDGAPLPLEEMKRAMRLDALAHGALERWGL